MDGIVITYDKDRKSIIKGHSWTYTDSLNLAEVLDQRHDKVLERIRKIIMDYGIEDSTLKRESSEKDKFIHKNTDFTYEECFYKNSQNKLQPYYKLSKDLLVLVIFSFRKLEKAQELQKAYICVLQNKSAEYCKLICRCDFTWSGGHDSLSWQSQPLILLASWLETHARRGSMSSCNIV